MLVVCLVYTDITITAPKCLGVQREARPCTYCQERKVLRSELQMILFMFCRLESWSSSSLQTDAKGSGWKWSSLMIPSLPSLSYGASCLFINLENEWRFVNCIAFVSYYISKQNESTCTFDFLNDPLYTVSLTAGTEKPFSMCKLWYRRRRVE